MAKYLDNNGLHTLVNSIKMWVITNLNEWWKLLKVGHSYLDSNSYSTDDNNTQWIYSVETIENTDSATKAKFPLIPKISFHSTDWKYSQWKPSSSSNFFPFPVGPARTMVARTPYPSYYTKAITICPQTGDMKGFTNCISPKFSTMSGGSNDILMSDGSTRGVSTLGRALKCNVTLKGMIENNIVGSYTLSNADRNTLRNYLYYFKTTDGVIFERMSSSRVSGSWVDAKFTAKYINTSTNEVVDVTASLDYTASKIIFASDGIKQQNYGQWKWIG